MCVRDQAKGLPGSGSCPCPTVASVGPGWQGQTFPSSSTQLEASSLHPIAAPTMLPLLWPGTGAEHPGGVCTKQDHAPRAQSIDPSTALDTGSGPGMWACLFWLGSAVASAAARPCMHFWKCFETVSPKGCCCLGAVQAIKPSSSSASGAPTPQLPLLWLCCSCWAMHSAFKLLNPPCFLPGFGNL